MDKEITNINGQTGGNIPDGLPIPSRYWAILAIGLGVTVSGLDRKRGFTYDCRRSPYESVCFYMGGERLSVGDHDFFAVVIVDGRDLGVSEGVYDRVAVI